MNRVLPKPVLIVFEGLDGTGKTTCARLLAEMLNAQYMTTPSEELRPHRQLVLESFGSCQEAAQLFYLATVFDASQRIKALIDTGRSVVLDRYFLSTQAYAEFRGSALNLDSQADKLIPADLTVYLDAGLAVRTQRLAARECTPADLETLTERASQELRALHEAKSGHSVVGKWVSIDTSVRSPQEVAWIVLRNLFEIPNFCDRASGVTIAARRAGVRSAAALPAVTESRMGGIQP